MSLRSCGHRRGIGRPQVATPPPVCFASLSWPIVRCARNYGDKHRRHLALGPSEARDRRRRLSTSSVVAADAAGAAADATEAAPTTPAPDQQHQQLDEAAVGNLLGWAQANGVDISRVGVFVEPGGERGFVAADAVPSKGSPPLLVVPLRLALVDQGPPPPPAPDQQQRQRQRQGQRQRQRQPHYYDGAPWSVRLASRLMRERGLAGRSPWSAYVSALPRRVPVASAWGWDAARALRDPRCERAVHAAAWLADDAFERLSPRAAEVWGAEAAALPQGLLRERWDWALSCVHSRTFLVVAAAESDDDADDAADGGGQGQRRRRMGARAMVPLIDLVNHAGDEAGAAWGRSFCSPAPSSSPSSSSCSFGQAAAESTALARDNVRWDLVRVPRPGFFASSSSSSPSSGGGEEWALALTALRPLARGEELLLSYGERPNDDFLVHYGFVPPLNPHDDVELFAAGSSPGSSSGGAAPSLSEEEEAAAAKSRAAAEAALEDAAEWHWAQRRRGGGGGLGAEEGEEAAARRYGAAVARAVEAEVAARAPGDDGGLRVSAGSRVSPGLVALFAELEEGAGDGGPGSAQQQQHQRAAERLVARRCWQLLARERDWRLLRDLAALALAEASRGEGEEQGQEGEGQRDRPFGAWLLPHYYRALVVEKGLCGPDGAWVLGVEEEQGAGDGGRDNSDPPPTALALARRILGGDEEAAAATGNDYEAHLATTFRAYKAMILADCVVDSGASLRDLN